MASVIVRLATSSCCQRPLSLASDFSFLSFFFPPFFFLAVMSRHGLPHHPIICLFSNPVNIKTTSGVRTTPRWIRARTCCGDPLKSEMLGELKYSMLPVTGRCQQKRTGPAARPPGAPRRRRAVWGSVWVRGPARVSAGTARGYVSRQEAGGQRTGRLNTRFPRHAARPPQGLWGGDTAPPPPPRDLRAEVAGQGYSSSPPTRLLPVARSRHKSQGLEGQPGQRTRPGSENRHHQGPR